MHVDHVRPALVEHPLEAAAGGHRPHRTEPVAHVVERPDVDHLVVADLVADDVHPGLAEPADLVVDDRILAGR